MTFSFQIFSFKLDLSFFVFFRYGNFEDMLTRMDKVEGGIEKMALGHEYFGKLFSKKLILTNIFLNLLFILLF